MFTAHNCLFLLPRSAVEPEVVKRESAAALPVVIVTLAYYARPVPLPESAPGESAAFAGWRVQVKRPCRMRLVCSVARNRALSKRYQQITEFGHYVERNQKSKSTERTLSFPRIGSA